MNELSYQQLAQHLKHDVAYFFVEELGIFLSFKELRIDELGKVKVILKKGKVYEKPGV